MAGSSLSRKSLPLSVEKLIIRFALTTVYVCNRKLFDSTNDYQDMTKFSSREAPGYEFVVGEIQQLAGDDRCELPALAGARQSDLG